MTAILVFILIIIGFNLIPSWSKKRFYKTENIISRILILAIFVFVTMILLSFGGIKLKGIYTSKVIGIVFILSSITYFTLFKNTTRKIISVVVLLPMILMSFYLSVFNQTILSYKVNDDINLVVSSEGFLACGEIIRLTKTKSIIFEKELLYNNECLRGIYKIETIEFNENKAEFLIFHNSELDSENPYSYKITNKNVW